MLFVLSFALFSSLSVTSHAFYVKSNLDEPTVRRLMLTSNVRKSSMEIAALGGFVTQQLSKNYIIVHLLERIQWKDTNFTRLATDHNYPSATEYAEARGIFDLVNRPYEEDASGIESSETDDDDCPDGDCSLNEEDYTLKFEQEDDDEHIVVEEWTTTTSRPLPPMEKTSQVTKRPQAQKHATPTSAAFTAASSPSSWVLEWHMKDGPTAKTMVSSGVRFCLQTLTVTAGALITLTWVFSL